VCYLVASRRSIALHGRHRPRMATVDFDFAIGRAARGLLRRDWDHEFAAAVRPDEIDVVFL